jgi:hypothetical protein
MTTLLLEIDLSNEEMLKLLSKMMDQENLAKQIGKQILAQWGGVAAADQPTTPTVSHRKHTPPEMAAKIYEMRGRGMEPAAIARAIGGITPGRVASVIRHKPHVYGLTRNGTIPLRTTNKKRSRAAREPEPIIEEPAPVPRNAGLSA